MDEVTSPCYFTTHGDSYPRPPRWIGISIPAARLSEQEKVPKDQWCYEPNAEGEYASGMRAKADYLSRVGYRLPTETEWEYACRAGAVTRYYFGQQAGLLDAYAWYRANSESRCWPVGRLIPNDFGLFDMHGNVWIWCYSRAGKHDHGADDSEDLEPVENRKLRVLRGGSCFSSAADLRAAFRKEISPETRASTYGFRVARTYR